MIIFEFAKNRSDIKHELMDKTPKVVEHIIKIILFREDSSVNHWMHEIFSFIHKIDISKSTKKRPKESFIYENTFGCVKDNYKIKDYVRRDISNICDEEGLDAPFTSDDFLELYMDKIYEVCDNYFRWLSKELSECGIVSFGDVKRILTNLIY